MTDRLKGFVVTFKQPICDNEAEAIKQAILMIRGVFGVQQITDNMDDIMNRSMVKNELREKLWEIVK